MNTDGEIGNEECPFEPVPVHTGTGVSTFLATEPTTSDTIVVLVALRGHSSLTTFECLPSATSLGQHGMVGIGLSGFAPARSWGQQARGELGGKIVDRKRYILWKVGVVVRRGRMGVVIGEGRGGGLERKLLVREHGFSGRCEGIGGLGV